jgi:hypothetical protein
MAKEGPGRLSTDELTLARRLYEDADMLAARGALTTTTRKLDARARALVSDLCFLLTQCSDLTTVEARLRLTFTDIARDIEDGRS